MITSASNPDLADEVVGLQNAITGATLSSLANLARLLHGKSPVEIKHGPAHPSEVVGARDGVKLLRYAAKGPRKGSLLVVASLINRFYVLDLLNGISVIDGFCKQGFDVFALDWQPPGKAGLSRNFTDYVDNIIPWGAREAAGGQDGGVHVLGYCMGGTMAAMHAALHPEQVKALMLLGTPIDFHKSGVLATFTKPDVFDADLMVDALGNVPPSMLQAAFKAMAPSSLMNKFWDLSEKAEDADAVIHYAAVERWLEDNISFPGGLYRPYIRGLYQDNGLVEGTMTVGSRKVDLHQLTMPVLNIMGLKDNIVNVEGSRGLMPFLKNGKELVFDTGHIGLTTSKRAHRDLWPQVHQWALENA
jgi:polyhydroxyalkanoate synthase